MHRVFIRLKFELVWNIKWLEGFFTGPSFRDGNEIICFPFEIINNNYFKTFLTTGIHSSFSRWSVEFILTICHRIFWRQIKSPYDNGLQWWPCLDTRRLSVQNSHFELTLNYFYTKVTQNENFEYIYINFKTNTDNISNIYDNLINQTTIKSNTEAKNLIPNTKNIMKNTKHIIKHNLT